MGTGIRGDYTGFSFGNVHSEDLGITHVSGGDRYSMELLPSFQDKTVDVPGGDGTYYFGSLYKNREFSLDIAYDEVTEEQLRTMIALFSDRQIKPLVFDEYPYKTYYARISSSPKFDYVAFDLSEDSDYEAHIWSYEGSDSNYGDVSLRIYKGEATIEFVCYDPYAHCSGYKKILDNYNDTHQWNYTSGLFINKPLLTQEEFDENNIDRYVNDGYKLYNPGDVETPFKLTWLKSAPPGDVYMKIYDDTIQYIEEKELEVGQETLSCEDFIDMESDIINITLKTAEMQEVPFIEESYLQDRGVWRFSFRGNRVNEILNSELRINNVLKTFGTDYTIIVEYQDNEELGFNDFYLQINGVQPTYEQIKFKIQPTIKLIKDHDYTFDNATKTLTFTNTLWHYYDYPTIMTFTIGGVFDGRFIKFKIDENDFKENDVKVVYDSKLHLLYGLDENNKKTGTVYNEYVTAGDFFTIPMTNKGTYPVLSFETVVPFPAPTLEYDYLYF